jgi:hypothetical protein
VRYGFSDRPLDHRGAGTAPTPAWLVCFRLPAGFAAEFVDRDTTLLTGPMSVSVTDLVAEPVESVSDDEPGSDQNPAFW